MARTESQQDVLFTSLDDLDAFVSTLPEAYILFYASWCPYSQAFLPIFEKISNENQERCARAVVDDDEGLWNKYDIRVVPTVLLFEHGQQTRRLDGIPHQGLNETQLRQFITTTQ
jgi:thioredoxin-like negative regulator of GroEL